MKQKTIRFNSYWLKIYKHVGALRIDGGFNAFKKNPERQTTNMLASSDGQLRKISETGRILTEMAEDLLLQRKKKKKWWDSL